MYTARFGDMWDRWGAPNSLFCVTTNAYIRRDGALVMGRGIARQLRDIQPEVAWDAAELIREFERRLYGFVTLMVVQPANRVRSEIHQLVGLFQVKNHFRDPADLKIIEHSVQMLKAYLFDHQQELVEVNLNYPGIGYGHRTVEAVEPLLRSLPPAINVWRFANES